MIRRKIGQSRYRNAILLVESSQTKQYAGVVLVTEVPVCDHTCYATATKNIVACVLEKYDKPVDLTYRPEMHTQITHTHTKIDYIHLKHELKMVSSFSEVRFCYKQKLAILRTFINSLN